MLYKICKECLIEKSINLFYTHPQGILGVLPRCKECIKKGRRTDRERAMARINDKNRNSTQKRKEFSKKQLINFRKNNPEKYKAQRMVSNFLRKNKNFKPTKCFVSGFEGGIIHLHHFDYSKPNMVIPCTPKIHSDFHHGKIIEIKKEWIISLPF